MATYTLIPSSWTSNKSISNKSNAYTDTTSSTYTSVTFRDTDTVYLGGFNANTIPSNEAVVSVKVKLKWLSSSYTNIHAYVTSDTTANGVWLSSSALLYNGNATVYTFDLTENIDTIMSCLGTLSIRFVTSLTSNLSMYVYGAEVIVETSPLRKNKVEYGNQTLIDLSADTIYPTDVRSGVSFHMKNGVQTVGEFPMKLHVARFYTSNSVTTLTFDVCKEPSWFVIVPWSVTYSSGYQYDMFVLFDGESAKICSANSTSSSSKVSFTFQTAPTVTFSSNVLTVYDNYSSFGPCVWMLFYL